MITLTPLFVSLPYLCLLSLPRSYTEVLLVPARKLVINEEMEVLAYRKT